MIDFADPKPGLVSWSLIGLMAITFIIFAKWFTQKVKIPGITELVAGV